MPHVSLRLSQKRRPAALASLGALLLAAVLVGAAPAHAEEADAPNSQVASRVCGLAWAERGYRDGAAGRGFQPHPFGNRAEAAAACGRAGLAGPSFEAYRARHALGAMSARNARPSGRAQLRANLSDAQDATAAAGRGTQALRRSPLCDSATPAAIASAPADCVIVVAPSRSARLEQLRANQRRAAERAQSRRRLDLEATRLRLQAGRPGLSASARNQLESRLNRLATDRRNMLLGR